MKAQSIALSVWILVLAAGAEMGNMSFRIVQSCERKDEQVATGVYAAPVESTELRDPGALIIDEFLTEEDEASILASLEAEDLENTDDDWSEDELTFGLLLPEIS